MGTHAGLWIDHRKAMVVIITDTEEAARVVESNVERHVRYSGGGHAGESHESQPETGEGTRERHFDDQLHRYYEEVIALIRNAEGILILGPGEAKGELRARLERDGLGARVVGVETVDKMTDRQVAARVREHFAR